jgi:large subunit ribosomal protein L10
MKKEKQLLLDEVKAQMDQHGSFVITQYEAVTANTINDFRNVVAKLGGDVQMIRKRVLAKAAAEAGVELSLEQLPGHISVVFTGNDPLETTKAAFKFSDENKEKVHVLGGRIEGQLYNAADMKMLSTLPGKDEMRAQILGLLEAPMSQTVGVMNAILTCVLHCLENKAKKDSE